MSNFHDNKRRAKNLLLEILGLATGNLEMPEENRQAYVYATMFELLEIVQDDNVNTIAEHLQWFVFGETDEWQTAVASYRQRVLKDQQVLDLSNYPQNGCLDLAKNVNSAIANPETPEETRNTLKLMVDEMVTGGLPEYSPQIVEAFMCAPVNDVWCKSFKKELKGALCQKSESDE